MYLNDEKSILLRGEKLDSSTSPDFLYTIQVLNMFQHK